MRYRYRTDEELKDSGVEWIGKIPKDWEIKKIKHIFEEISEKNYSEDVELLSLYTHIGVKPQKELEAKGNKAQTVIEYKIVEKNDIVVNKMLAWMGAIGISEYNGVISPAYNIYRKYNKCINSKFYHYLFRTKKFSNECYKNGWGIMLMRWTTTPERFKDIYVPYIPFVDEKIANFLDKKTSQFDSIISKKEKLIEKLEEAKKSLISEVVTGKVKVVKSDEGYELVKIKSDEMKDSGVEWLGYIPKDWEVKRLRFLGKLQNGISKNSEEFGFGYPFVSYSNVYRNIELPQKIEGLINSTKEERKIYSVREGDVLFTRTSETINEIGLASTCMDTIENSTFAGFLIRFRPSYKRLYKGFSKYYFRCDLNRKYFVKEMNLVTRASLSQNLLNNLAVTLPDYKEQVEIYNALELKIGAINLSIDNLKYQIDKLKEAKQSLISEAVTGKIEILD